MRDRWRGVLTRHPRILGGLFAVYWLTIFTATHIEMPKVEAAPRNTDKLVHLVMYGGFAFWLSLWLASRKVPLARIKWITLGTSVIYGILDELLQIPIESRSADVWDFVTDVCGATLGFLLFAALRSRVGWLWESDSAG
ncbi:MAG: VanZ family protein [Planctomycetaceae bacterium]|nr:VanZ family protein [Planctomycetaceae bacterium]